MEYQNFIKATEIVESCVYVGVCVPLQGNSIVHTWHSLTSPPTQLILKTQPLFARVCVCVSFTQNQKLQKLISNSFFFVLLYISTMQPLEQYLKLKIYPPRVEEKAVGTQAS